jgi:hypothetical protein
VAEGQPVADERGLEAAQGQTVSASLTSLAIADISGRRAGFGLSASQAPPFSSACFAEVGGFDSLG